MNLFKYLCVDHLKLCCLPGLFGPNCDQCIGYPDNICNKHGHCDGEGKRNGTGKCNCDSGYTGDICNECAAHYLQVNDVCEECHKGCEGQCTALGAKGCVACKKGYFEHPELGCHDLNECLIPKGASNPCEGATFCMNTQGSYECLRKLILDGEEERKKNILDISVCCRTYCK